MDLMDMMIRTNRFCEFINELIRFRNEEQEEKAIWEMWLHKVFDQSYADFKSKLMTGKDTKAPSKDEIELTIKDSFGLLNGFVPDGVQENDGTVSLTGDSSD